MSEHANQAQEPEVTSAPEFKPTEDYKKIIAGLDEVARSLDNTATKAEKIAQIQAEARAEEKRIREKTRPVKGGDGRDVKVRRFDDLLHVKAVDNETKEIQELNDRAILKAVVKSYKMGEVPKTPQGHIDVRKLPREAFKDIDEYRYLNYYREKAAGFFWDTSTADSGTEWVPTGFSRLHYEFHSTDAPLPQLFDQVNIPDGVGTFSVPVSDTKPTAFIWSEKTAASGTFVDTAIFSQSKTTTADLAPKKHANGHAISMEGVEDLVVDSLMRAREASALAVRRGVVEAMINGQTASDTTLDDAPATSGLDAADGYSTANGDNGLRLFCIVGSFTTAVAGNLNADDLWTGREAMSSLGMNPDDLLWVMSPKAYAGLLATDQIETLDKFGPAATILTGELGRIGGVRVVPTSEFPETLDTGGINAGAGSTTTGAVLVNRRRWIFGSKRQLSTIMLPQPGMDIMNIITTARTHFVAAINATNASTSAAEHSAHYFINVT